MKNKEQYLQAMGVVVWKEKKMTAIDAAAKIRQQETSVALTWEELECEVKNCTCCDLYKSRNNVVFGVGDRHAKVMFIGEAPGANEDLQGEPFVGRAGMLLNSMLLSIQLKRDKIYIANILKCRPPENRDPSPAEVKECTKHLQQQIAIIKPRVLVAVGKIAAHFLLNTDEAMGKLRGQVFSYGEQETPLLVTYHPAYLLRSPREKSKAYEDMLTLQSMIK